MSIWQAEGALIILALLVLVVLWAAERRDQRQTEDEDDDLPGVVGFWIRVPQLVSGDGSPIGPEDIEAASRVLAQRITTLANAVHAEAMATVTAQVAHQAAAGIDDEITTYLNENGAA